MRISWGGVLQTITLICIDTAQSLLPQTSPSRHRNFEIAQKIRDWY